MATQQKEKVETLERGNIYFFYRPRVEEDNPSGQDDLQRMYMVLSPDGEKRYRLAIVGRKELPDPGKSGKERNWFFMRLVRKDPKAIREELAAEKYDTKTRGERHVPAARPAGEGVYRICRHGDHTHLVYALELPKSLGDVQEDLQIEETASYIINVKNPEKGSPRYAGLSEDEQAEFPKSLQEKFEDRKFYSVDPPKFLDYEGAEFVLISAKEDPEKELDIEFDTDSESKASADMFKDLKIDKDNRPTEPLFEGDWA